MFLLMTVCTCFPASAYEFGIFEYEIINDNQAKIVGCKDFNGGHISIPSSLTHDGKEYPIVEIGDNAFSNKNISTVDIPEGITTIGVAAFSFNLLKEVILPQSLQVLDSDAFSCNDLTSINIPPLVITQPNEWGGYPTLLSEAGGNDNTIENIVIEPSELPLEALIYVNCQNLIIGREFKGVCCEGVSNSLSFVAPVDNHAINFDILKYYNVLPTEINIKGKNLELIGSIFQSALENRQYFEKYDFAKALQNINNINIECDNLSLGNKAFYNLMADINLNVSGQTETQGGAFYGCKSVNNVDLSSLSNIKAGEFQNITGMEYFTVSGFCKAINNTAFSGCNNLKDFVLAEGDTPLIVGTGTFEEIPVEKLTLGRNIISGDLPFYGLKTLKTLVLSSNISELPDYAFADCSNLGEIYCESANPPQIHKNTFKGVDKDECKIFVKSNEGEYRQAEGWNDFFASVVEPDVNKQSVNVHSKGDNIIISGIEDKNVSVYSLDGTERVAYQKVNGDIEFPLPNGMYLIVAGNNTIKYFHSKK